MKIASFCLSSYHKLLKTIVEGSDFGRTRSLVVVASFQAVYHYVHRLDAIIFFNYVNLV